MRILVVEDDKIIAETLADALTKELFIVDIATDGQAGWQQAQACNYDLILLDLMLPKLDGITLCQKLRSINKKIPILLLTARDNSQDKIKGLDAGADDYVVKPFNLEELLARIRALLRRGNESASVIKKWCGLCLNPQSCEVSYNDKQLNLTPKEYEILNLLMHNTQRVFSCSVILDRVWDLEDIPTEDTVRAHIKGLRHKLKSAGAPSDLIETVYGLGYRLKQEKNNLPLKKSKKKKKNQPNISQESQQKLQQSINKIWDRVKGSISERIDVVEQAVIAGKNGKLETNLQHQAQQEAHKLAGSLGTFGLNYGSDLARKIETLLTPELPLNYAQSCHIYTLVISLRNEIYQHSNIGNKQTLNQQLKSLDAKSSTQTYLRYTDSFSQECKLLLILEDNLLAKELVQEATTKKVECMVAKNSTLLTDIDGFINHNCNFHCQDLLFSANVALLDLEIASNAEKILAKFSNQMPFLPVVVLNTQGDLSDRIKIAKLGASAYLTKQLPAAQVIDIVLDIWRKNQIPGTVMIVDDDLPTLEVIKHILTQWGIKVVTLNDERYFWKTLEDTAPDLLILDIEMPHFNGIDLCKVIRNDPHWSGIPVVFITAHKDPNIHNQIFAAGADDYLSKPFKYSDLVTRIINRIKRTPSI
ncbi:response regulator [Dapis sp. BLCC M172]|uniref:response regulator n=1 Tax=Dapis sp. BLCC M172 TaxID=2975281 RepID=UPI003CED1A6E